MQRTKTIAIGVLALLVVGVLSLASHASKSARKKEAGAAAAAPSASTSASAQAVGGPPPVAALESAVEVALSPEDGGEGFDLLPNGQKAPPLPEAAPQRISFGVIQFVYEGAQFAPKGARTKLEAKARATSTIEQATKDFSAAVARGDQGSSSNMGRIPRGILEPALEYLLFTLPKGQVHPEPIDTPRGYWVVRRID